MPTQPLFIADDTTLKSRLRMSGAAQTDALAIIDSVVEEVRAGFIEALGVDRVGVLLSYPYDTATLSLTGALRLKANSTELAWVKLKLIRALPILFMDSAGIKREVWNEEGMTRKANSGDLSAELNRLEADVAAGLSDLAGDGSSSVGGVQGGTIGPKVAPPKPFDSIRPVCGGFVDGFGFRGGRECGDGVQ